MPETAEKKSGLSLRPVEQGRFVLIAGLGHNGSKWLSMVLDRPDLEMKAAHERKNEDCGIRWDDSLKYEMAHGVDEKFLPYLEAVDRDLDHHRAVVDSNSWQPFAIPLLDRVFHVDEVIYIVRNGIQSVHSMYEHNSDTTEFSWLEREFLPFYGRLLGREKELEQLGSFEKWCFWWELNGLLPGWLREQLGAERVHVYRLEDLTGDVNVLREVISLAAGSGDIGLDDGELRSLQQRDVNRKIAGERSPGHLWSLWDERRRTGFRRRCEETMQRFGYSIPEASLNAVPTGVDPVPVSPPPSFDKREARVTLPGDSGPEIDIVEVDQLHHVLGFGSPLQYPPSSLRKPFEQWKMEEDDSPIFRYLYRNFKPERHLEFGTWQGIGTMYVLEECEATVWTLNLLSGEISEDGGNAYGGYAHELPELRAWAEKMRIMPVPSGGYVTDSVGFIGRHYLARGLGNRVCQLYCDSRDWDISKYPPDFFDTALIDGGHTREIVLNDTEKAMRLVRSGGLVLWHDFCPLMYGKSETVTGVMDGVAAFSDKIRQGFDRLFWIRPSFILLGIRS